MRFSAASGIAIGPILFVVALLAILATAIAAGSSTFSGGTDQEAARVNASAIIDVASTLRAGVARLTALGCSDTQISFSNPIITSLHGYDPYTNPSAPADYHCHVFHVLGGGLQFPQITASTLETEDGGRFIFEGSNGFMGVGTSISDLAAFLPVDSLDLCRNINTLLGVSSYWGGDWYMTPSATPNGYFTGNYNQGNNISTDAGNWPSGQAMGCLEEAEGGYQVHNHSYVRPINARYFFYVVLLTR